MRRFKISCEDFSLQDEINEMFSYLGEEKCFLKNLALCALYTKTPQCALVLGPLLEYLPRCK